MITAHHITHALNHQVIVMTETKKKTAKYSKVRKGAKIKNRYNQVPQQTQDTMRK